MFYSEQQSANRFRAAQFSHLRHLALLALVVEAGSFTVAAQRIGLGKSGVSRLISELEDFVGVKLLNRSTRALSLTEEGQLFYADCARLVDAAVEAFDKLDPDLPLAGTLNIAASTAHGNFAMPPAIAEFTGRHPDLKINLTLSEGFVDLVDNGIDLAIRVGSPGPSPHYISRRIGTFSYRLFGAAPLLEQYSMIATPQDAAALPWMMSSLGNAPAEWTFQKGDAETQVTVTGPVTVDNLMTRLAMAQSGLGLIGVPDFIPESVLAGMVQLLPEYRIVPEIPIYAVTPSARFLSPKVSEFLEYLRKQHEERRS